MSDAKPLVAIAQGSSAYGSLTALDAEIARVLPELGCEPLFLPLSEPVWAERMTKVLKERGPSAILCGIGCNGIGIEIGDDLPTGNMWHRLGIPFVSWLGDSPAYFQHRHRHPSPWIIRAYTCPDFLDYHTTYLREPGRNAVVDFGVMSFGQPPQPRARGGKPMILAPKSYRDPAVVRQSWVAWPTLMRQVLENASQTILKAANPAFWPEHGIAGAVVHAAHESGLALEYDKPLLALLAAQVDDYTRRESMDQALRQLADFPVIIYGSNLDSLKASLPRSPRADFRGAIEYKDLTNLYHQADVIFSVNPNTQDGAHDRVWSAFGCGALPVSNRIRYMESLGPELAPYLVDLEGGQGLGDVLDHVLSQPDQARDVGWALSERMRAARPFVNAVGELLELARVTRLLQGPTVFAQDYFVKDLQP
ncbi:MAG: glycosyltransferase family 1 protein [Alphaproteobacteria bacterium]|nr:MAG: glycosyltransferase family 1 protein [Alphaproteobacteria bacterium]